MSKSLSNKTALVTGASRGIGRAIAKRLASDGAHVFVHYNRSSNEADSLVAQIAQDGGSAEAVAANLEDVDAVNRLIADIKARLGNRKLDVLVNNAGIIDHVALGESDGSALDRLLAVNVRAPFQLTSGLIGSLADDARVLFTSSIVAKTVFPGISAYALTKGAIDTEMAADFVGTDEGKAQVKSIQALKRVGQPSDIANVAGFLAGPDSGWVTGQVIDVSGGSKL